MPRARRLTAARRALPAVALGLLAAAPAFAKPQWNLGVEAALCRLSQAEQETRSDFCGAVHGDLMLLRERATGFDIGPALRLGSAGFGDLRTDVGLGALLPVFSSFPLVLEAGPHFLGASAVGLHAGAFFGVRSFNHYGSYEIACGLVAAHQRVFDDEHRSAWWIGVRLDGGLLALPLLLGYGALRR
jgi:hypothetical protein